MSDDRGYVPPGQPHGDDRDRQPRDPLSDRDRYDDRDRSRDDPERRDDSRRDAPRDGRDDRDRYNERDRDRYDDRDRDRYDDRDRDRDRGRNDSRDRDRDRRDPRDRPPPRRGAAPAKKKGKGGLIAAAVVVVAALAAAAVYFLVLSGDDETAEGPAGVPAANEVLLVPASGPGPGPMVTGDFAVAPDAALAKAVDRPDASLQGERSVAIAAESGDTAGLHAGLPEGGECDVAALGAALAADPGVAATVVEILNGDATLALDPQLTTSDVAAQPATFVPAILLKDTRVTYQVWEGGNVTARPAVIQKGTPVLVDPFGVPRYRCSSGNLLSATTAVEGVPTYVGDAWSDFDPATLVAISPASSAQRSFDLVDRATSETFSRRVGGQGRTIRHDDGSFEFTVQDMDGWQVATSEFSQTAEGAAVIDYAPDLQTRLDGLGVGLVVINLSASPMTPEDYVAGRVDLENPDCPSSDVSDFEHEGSTGSMITVDPCTAPDGSWDVPFRTTTFGVTRPDGAKLALIVNGDEHRPLALEVLETFTLL